MREIFGSSAGLLLTLVLAGLGAWLLWGHSGHVLLAVPYLFLLACPLMHVMHRAHHHHRSPDAPHNKVGPSTEGQ